MMSYLRTLLVLGRVSNLPTVWSNCLAGWWLAGGGAMNNLPWLLAGTTFLYVGGMFSNDAFDANFDRVYRRERPIPSGAISLGAVWRWSLTWLVAGLVCLFWINGKCGLLGLCLVGCILAYNAIHKRFAFSVVLMGLCRFYLYVIAAASVSGGALGRAIWCGLALALYVMGLTILARRETARDGIIHNLPPAAQSFPPEGPGGVPPPGQAPEGRHGQFAGKDVHTTGGVVPWAYWLPFLLAPTVLAFIMNVGGHRNDALVVSALLILWGFRALRPTLWATPRQIGQTVSGLLAGIVLVDCLAACDAPQETIFLFLGLFLSALALQRLVPAT